MALAPTSKRAGYRTSSPDVMKSRAAATEHYDVFSLHTDNVLDGITHACARVCGTRMAAITFPGASSTARDHCFIASSACNPKAIPFEWAKLKSTESVCAVALDNYDSATGAFVVEDLRQDASLRSLRVVTDGGVVFYGGVAVKVRVRGESVPIGMLYVLDTEPRALSPALTDMLRAFAASIASHLELRLANRTTLACQARREAERSQQAAEVAAAHQVSRQLEEAVHFLSHETRNQMVSLHAVAGKAPRDVDAGDLAALGTCADTVETILGNVLLMSKMKHTAPDEVRRALAGRCADFPLRPLLDACARYGAEMLHRKHQATLRRHRNHNPFDDGLGGWSSNSLHGDDSDVNNHHHDNNTSSGNASDPQHTDNRRRHHHHHHHHHHHPHTCNGNGNRMSSSSGSDTADSSSDDSLFAFGGGTPRLTTTSPTSISSPATDGRACNVYPTVAPAAVGDAADADPPLQLKSQVSVSPAAVAILGGGEGIGSGAHNGELLVHGNRQYPMQIITNLLSNAAKYTDSGHIVFTATLDVAPPAMTTTTTSKDTATTGPTTPGESPSLAPGSAGSRIFTRASSRSHGHSHSRSSSCSSWGLRGGGDDSPAADGTLTAVRAADSTPAAVTGGDDDATPPGGPRGSELRSGRSCGEAGTDRGKRGLVLRITVEDTGVGIRPEDMPVVMMPFGQVDHSSSSAPPGCRRPRGTGLGLPLSKKMAEALGGSLTLTSERGRGTQVEVTIPLQVPAAAAAAGVAASAAGAAGAGTTVVAQPPAEQAQPVTTSTALPAWVSSSTPPTASSSAPVSPSQSVAAAVGARGKEEEWASWVALTLQELQRGGHTADVLVVEDNALQQKLYRHRARKSGLRVAVHDSPVAALDRVRRGERFGAVVVDLQMPELNGDEVCRALRDELGYAGVVVCATGSSFGDTAERRQFARDHGFTDVVTKGASPSVFDMLGEVGRRNQDRLGGAARIGDTARGDNNDGGPRTAVAML